MALVTEVGKKLDDGKARWDLLPFPAIEEVVMVLTFGANKYAPDQWRHVPEARRRYIAALWRHVVRWIRGEKSDPESGLHHLAHAACCVLFLLSFDLETDATR